MPLKYVTWMHSSPALIALVALAGDAPLAEYHAAVARSAGIFVLGFAGMYVRSPVPTFALLSVALGCTVVAALWRWFGSAIEATVKGEPARRALRVCRVWSVLTWLAFPLVFASELLPGPRLRRPGPRQLAFAYAVVDFATKALWASSVAAAALQALEARREAAAAARTATSRAAVTDMRRALAAIRAGLGL